MYRTKAFSLLELLVAVAIIGVLVGLLLPAVQKVREASKTLECQGNLHQIGVAANMYVDSAGRFPNIWRAEGLKYRLLFRDLAPYIEQESNTGTIAVKTYLCPGRRGPEVGPKFDYGAADFSLGWLPDHFSNWPSRSCSVLFPNGNSNPYGVKREDVNAGLSNVLALAHKGLDPRFYNTSFCFGFPDPDPWGQSILQDWFFYNASFKADRPWNDFTDPSANQFGMWGLWANTSRWGYGFYRDANDGVDIGQAAWLAQPTSALSLFTSPHGGGMPCLFGDGSVRTMAYRTTPVYHPHVSVAASEDDLLMLSLWNTKALSEDYVKDTFTIGLLE